MRKLLYSAMTLAAAAALATPALAQPPGYYDHHVRHVYHHHYVRHVYRAERYAPAGYRAYAYAPPYEPPYHSRAAGAIGAGVVAGTVAGLGVSEGWWGATVAGAALPTTVAGAAAIGGVAGIGAAALVDAALEPCRGFAAMFNLSEGECVNGHYVGPGARHPAPPHYR